jgi:hypothetical protein
LLAPKTFWKAKRLEARELIVAPTAKDSKRHTKKVILESGIISEPFQLSARISP